MSESSRLLVFGRSPESCSGPLIDRLREDHEVCVPENLVSGLRMLREDGVDCLFVASDVASPGVLLQASGVLEHLPDGIVLLDTALEVLWSNRRFVELAAEGTEAEVPGGSLGMSFYDVFGTPEILGPDFCPFNTALGSGEAAKSTIRVDEKSYYEVHAKPVLVGADEVPEFLVVIVRDVSSEVLQRQKLNAIYQAGLELGDLMPQDVLDMSVDERIELLKQKILHYTQDLLEFETVEIRLLDKHSKTLVPLLAVGMQPVATDRDLRADPQDNGVTGFVASTGKSYLCEDTENDPLYLPGAPDARSSLTVPLILHDEILGTFNVESPRPGAFDENDLQFLELFSREVAVALNTLELLAAEKMTTANESTELILREVAPPVDEILNDVTWVLEKYIGHDPEVCERLQQSLRHTRDIKQLIQKVGQEIAPKSAHQVQMLPPRPHRPKLVGKRILVVDGDRSVRRAAHELLGRFGCEVETAHHGEEAVMMCRRAPYDAVIADIRLPDMNGYECFCGIRGVEPDLPVILMTGFGYDPAHAIVKARQDGLQSVLYKPFRLDQLLTEVEKTVGGTTPTPTE